MDLMRGWTRAAQSERQNVEKVQVCSKRTSYIQPCQIYRRGKLQKVGNIPAYVHAHFWYFSRAHVSTCGRKHPMPALG